MTPPAEISTQASKSPSLETKIASLEKSLNELTAKQEALRVTLKLFKKRLFRNPDAASTVKKHITLLHTYNEIRDVALGLIGKIADQERCRVVEIMNRFGITKDD
ncbi:hypothetical protein PORY_000663 [Pneumocystis oryctolagi]|uniref:Uncharacterized protein n=1 Tax=Pneumocystis oryctolagi TaxID=42067 RepID=A0ACB7CFM7_9ASCO|nr:hypothetical protein PORY_000663 [Pneumocystis oryctolagi]